MGQKKLLHMGIGKRKHLFCFLKDYSELPMSYRNSANAFMTSLFQEWLKTWNRELCLQNSHMCLLINSCPAHLVNVQLSHVFKIFASQHDVRHAVDGHGM